MSRGLSHSWDNRVGAAKGRQYKSWTRRVRWYSETRRWDPEFKVDVHTDIRLNFEDTESKCNCYYGDDQVAAQRDYDRFKKGEASASQLWTESEARQSKQGEQK